MRQTQKNYVGVLIDGQNRFYEALTAFNKMHNLQFKFKIIFPMPNDINLHNFCMDYNNTTEHVKPFINSNHNDSFLLLLLRNITLKVIVIIEFLLPSYAFISGIYVWFMIHDSSWKRLSRTLKCSELLHSIRDKHSRMEKNLFQFSNVRWSHAVYIFEVLDCDNSIFCKRHWAGKKDGYGWNG